MIRPVRAPALFLSALMLLLGAAPRAAEASLIGDSVTCATTTAPQFNCAPATATVGSGAEFTLSVPFQDFFSVDVAASSITDAFAIPPDSTLTLENFGLLTFGSLDSSLGDVVGVSLTTTGLITGIDASDLSFTAHSVTLDLNGNNFWANPPDSPVASAVISLLFADAAAVPGPATLLLLASAITGLGAVRAWRRP